MTMRVMAPRWLLACSLNCAVLTAAAGQELHRLQIRVPQAVFDRDEVLRLRFSVETFKKPPSIRDGSITYPPGPANWRLYIEKLGSQGALTSRTLDATAVRRPQGPGVGNGVWEWSKPLREIAPDPGVYRVCVAWGEFTDRSVSFSVDQNVLPHWIKRDFRAEQPVFLLGLPVMVRATLHNAGSTPWVCSPKYGLPVTGGAEPARLWFQLTGEDSNGKPVGVLNPNAHTF